MEQKITREPKVCHVIASINKNTGGTALSVTSLAEALAKENIESHIFTLNYKSLGEQFIPQNVSLHGLPAGILARYFRGYHPAASTILNELASKKKIDLIHNHGLWMFQNLYARQVAVSNNLPLIISPRGMLESWSMKRSRLKKRLAWTLYERQNLSCATLFHATSMEEVRSIRYLGFKQPIAMIPNGVQLPSASQDLNRGILTQIFPELSNKKWLLFLSRIHPKKGIDNLLIVWQKLVRKFPDWHLIIAGPDLIGYQKELKRLVAELSLEASTTFTGMLTGEKKGVALANAELFVLPTHSENFGIAIAEALAYRVPVITTKGAPWPDLETHECGWWIENSQAALEAALNEGMQISPKTRMEMGLRGQKLIEDKYSWESITKEMVDVYEWLLNSGPSPRCIQLDSSQ
jgi:glycosyltransferase involved in cell wall biosynthesis